MPISVSHIVEALSSLGGEAHLDQIVERVEQIAQPPLPADPGASIRARIQERCAEAVKWYRLAADQGDALAQGLPSAPGGA